MKLVEIESPFAAPTRAGVLRNIRYGRACLADSLARGEAPLASHLLYTQKGVLDDRVPAERELGMEAGKAWSSRCDLVAVYCDLGVSDGMRWGIKRAKTPRTVRQKVEAWICKRLGVEWPGTPVEYRRLGEWEPVTADEEE
jgi:hypothetical protein